jgi:cytochrome c oxidase subunit III
MSDKHRLGMALFVLSEAFFFLLLIGAYIYFRVGFNETPATAVLQPSTNRIGSPSGVLDVFRTGIFSVLLFSSSATIWLAERASRRQSRKRVRIWLGATIGLGALFLYGELTEYADLLRRSITISRDLFGSTFYTMTGFHGFHVFGGLVLLSILLGLTWSTEPRQRHDVAVQSVAIYWHFVDVVWVFIFSVVYLWR